MWKYRVDLSGISEAISKRADYNESQYLTNLLLKELGFTSEKVSRLLFEDLIYSKGDIEEVYTSAEMDIISSEEEIFFSIGKDIFNFFIIDIEEDYYANWYRFSGIIKIINKAFKGNNYILFQMKKRLMFGSRYYSSFVVRDFHMTYWIDDINIIEEFTAYNLCKQSAKYTYANFVAHVRKNSIFQEKYWVNDDEKLDEMLECNFVEMSRNMAFISSKQIDTFGFMREAEEAGKHAMENGRVYTEYSNQSIDFDDSDIDEEMYDNPEMLLKFIK